MVLDKEAATTREDEDEAVAVLSAAVLARSMGCIPVATSLEEQLRACGYVRAKVDVQMDGDVLGGLFGDGAGAEAGRGGLPPVGAAPLAAQGRNTLLFAPKVPVPTSEYGGSGETAGGGAETEAGSGSGSGSQAAGGGGAGGEAADDSSWEDWGTVLVGVTSEGGGGGSSAGAAGGGVVHPGGGLGGAGDRGPRHYAALRGACLPPGTLICSGSFRPFHAGHEGMMQAARRTVAARLAAEEKAAAEGQEQVDGAWDVAVGAGGGKEASSSSALAEGNGAAGDEGPEAELPPCVFEIAVRNADKPTVSKGDLLERVGQLVDPLPLLGLLPLGGTGSSGGSMTATDGPAPKRSKTDGPCHEVGDPAGELGLEAPPSRVRSTSLPPAISREHTVSSGGLVRKYSAPVTGVSGVRWPVICTPTPMFGGKARLFPGCWFVVGFDTARRVLDPKYYGGSREVVAVALAGLRSAGCRFVVAGRHEEAGGEAGEGSFRTVADLEESIPAVFREGLRPLFVGVPQGAFRMKRSSSAIRSVVGGADGGMER